MVVTLYVASTIIYLRLDLNINRIESSFAVFTVSCDIPLNCTFILK